MGRIVAIAGGDLSSTRELNIHTIMLTNKRNPNVQEGRNSFDRMLLGKNMVGLAMENNTAFVENNGE